MANDYEKYLPTEEELARARGEIDTANAFRSALEPLANARNRAQIALGMGKQFDFGGNVDAVKESAMAPLRDKAALLKAYQEKKAMEKEASLADAASPRNKAWRDSLRGMLANSRMNKLASSITDDMTPENMPDTFKNILSGEYGLAEKQAATGAEMAKLSRELPMKNLEAASKLRGEFQSAPIYKNMQTIDEARNKINAAFESEHTPQSDMSLIFGFMKLQDPNSTVREGEYASAQNAASVPEQIRNAYNKALEGKILDPKQRENFKNQSEEIYGAQYKSFTPHLEKYNKLSSAYGVDPSLVVSGFESPKTLASIKNKGLESLRDSTAMAKKPVVTDEDRKAYEWAKSNPNDQRSASILKALKQKGL